MPTNGKWIEGKGTLMLVTYTCGKCDQEDKWRAFSYNPRQHCPCCGAQMGVKTEPVR